MKLDFSEYHLFQILRRFENQHLPLDLFISQYFKANRALGSKDRLFLSETVYGMERWKSLLDYLVAPHPTWEKRYAVYKNFYPEQYQLVNTIPLPIRVSFPPFLFSILKKNYGEAKAVELCRILNTSAPTTIRVNPLKTTRDSLLESFKTKGMQAESCLHAPFGISFQKRVPLTSLTEFKEGLFEIQDEGSQMISQLIEANPKEHVLDYCAGSGGKTLGFAHKLENQGQIYLHDVRPFVLEQARKRLKRAGIQNAQFLAPEHMEWGKLKKKMHWVLVDSPCSGTGTWRRNPDQKWKLSLEQLQHLVKLQREIFEKALSFCRKGGKIVYATCSLLKEENEQQCDFFLKNFPLKLAQPYFISQPSFGGMDGFFAAVFENLSSV